MLYPGVLLTPACRFPTGTDYIFYLKRVCLVGSSLFPKESVRTHHLLCEDAPLGGYEHICSSR